MTVLAASRTASAVGGPCDGQRLIVHMAHGGQWPREVWVHRRIGPSDDPWPTRYHRYVWSGESYVYTPERQTA